MIAVGLLVLGCSLGSPDCPPGQYCAAQWDSSTKDCPAAGRCEALPAAPEVELWLPVPAGEAVFCAKGNLRPTGSHGSCSTNGRFAFDLATPVFSAPHLVLASADGVAYPFGGCTTDSLDQGHSDRCNLGWGNMVHLEHAPGLYTLYAHLASILVQPGERVRRGQPIGVEGNTGAAGTKHIHWSLHTGDAREGGVGPSVPMNRIHLDGRVVLWSDIACSDWLHDARVEQATRLVSDNALLAPAPPAYFGLQGPRAPALGSDEPTPARPITPAEAGGAAAALLVVAAISWWAGLRSGVKRRP